MDKDTDIGGRTARFPQTHASAIVAAASDDPSIRDRAIGQVVDAYWKPIYKYIRFKWRADNEQAKDFTQGFFADVLDRGLLARFDAGKAAFRTYLRVCVDGYVSNQRLAGTRQKRGGGLMHISLDFDGAESELQRQAAPNHDDPEAYFHREWVRGLFSRAVDRFRTSCESRGKPHYLSVFESYDLIEPDARNSLTYAQLADRLQLSESQVTNYLAAARRDFRKILLETLKETAGSEAEFRRDVRELLGPDVL